MKPAENLDSRLLRSQEEEQEAARRLKEEKRGQAGAEESEEVDADGEPRSLRQRVQAARQALDLKEQAKKKVEEKVMAPAKAGTSNVLRWAWMTLIPSWGLSLIYINMHVFSKYVFGEKLFCKLGEEWLPKQATEAAGEAGKTINKSIGIVEVMGLLILDLIVLVIILGFLALIVMTVDFIQADSWVKIKMIIGGLTGLGWSGIKALYSLFVG